MSLKYVPTNWLPTSCYAEILLVTLLYDLCYGLTILAYRSPTLSLLLNDDCNITKGNEPGGEVGFNLALGLVTSCCSCQTAIWRLVCCWLGYESMSIGESSKYHLAGSCALRDNEPVTYDIRGSNANQLHTVFNKRYSSLII